jgi:hypothetical protein
MRDANMSALQAAAAAPALNSYNGVDVFSPATPSGELMSLTGRLSARPGNSPMLERAASMTAT